MIRCDARTGISSLISPQGTLQQWENPLESLSWMSNHFAKVPSRWVGYLSYELGSRFEEMKLTTADDLNLPLFVFTLHELGESSAMKPTVHPQSSTPVRSSFSRGEYLQAVQRCIEYIKAGDVFQVNLSQRFTSGLNSQPAEIWSRLSSQAPAAYSAFLDYGDHAIVSNSPELFLRVEQPPGTNRRQVITRPIKGTRPNAPGMHDELQHSPKDQAELHMIVDLERNDLGRVCDIGSVKVVEPRVIENHGTVYHGVATIRGVLRDDVTFVDLLRATFPGGSITGAPKIRAMEVIDEMEPVRRGPYCGSIGYLASDGSMEFSIAIRTMVIKDGLVHTSVGGGIVADSNPQAEYEETLVKAKALFAALGLNAGEVAAVTR